MAKYEEALKELRTLLDDAKKLHEVDVKSVKEGIKLDGFIEGVQTAIYRLEMLRYSRRTICPDKK